MDHSLHALWCARTHVRVISILVRNVLVWEIGSPMQKKDVNTMPCHHQYVSQRRLRARVACQGDVRGTKPAKWLETRGSIAAPKAKNSAQKKTSRTT